MAEIENHTLLCSWPKYKRTQYRALIHSKCLI